jgi:hypothetical protein
MANHEEAYRMVSAWLLDRSARSNIELVLLEQNTIETDFGWLFFYESRGFKDIGNFSDSLAGNAPVIVDRAIGSLHLTATNRPTSDLIEEFRTTRAMVGLSSASFVGPLPMTTWFWRGCRGNMQISFRQLTDAWFIMAAFISVERVRNQIGTLSEGYGSEKTACH